MNAARKLYVADLFCGAGGTSTGVALACKELGIEVDKAVELLAINHWETAIATHKENHPWATHMCANLDTIDPRVVVPKGHLDLLVASPECTHHSVARGGRPVNDQSRASAFRVTEWCDKLDVSNVLVENVPEFVDWAPIGSNGRPLKSKKGEVFRRWVALLEAMNFKVSWRVLNAADYGGATTRRRLFIVARKRKSLFHWPQATHARNGGTEDLFGKLKPWRAAREIIDWSIKGKSIFTRKKPLAKTTLLRILAGFEKHGGPEARPFIDLLKSYIERVYPPLIQEWVTRIFRAEIRVLLPEETVSLVPPVPFVSILQRNSLPTSINRPLTTITANGKKLGLCESFVMAVDNGSSNGNPRSVGFPLPTVITRDRLALVAPEAFVLQQQSGGAARRVSLPLPTIAGMGAQALVSVEPMVLQQQSNGQARPVSLPVPTIATAGKQALITPFLVPFFGERTGQSPRFHDIRSPLPAVTSHGAGALVEGLSFLLPRRGFYQHWDNASRPLSLPLHTVTSRGAGSIVQPVIVNMKGRSTASSIFSPIPTQTTRRHFYMAEPVIVEPCHGGGLERRVHSVGAPLPTQPCSNRFGLAEGFIVGAGGPVYAGKPASLSDPLGAVLTRDRRALVQSLIVQTSNRGGNGLYSRSTAAPLYTVVTENQLALASACLIKVNHGKDEISRGQDLGEPLRTVTVKNGFGLAQPVLVKFYRDPAGNVQSVEEPIHTIPTKARFGLVESEEGEVYLDIFFRMLRPKELARAMGFEHYHFTGTTEEQVRQIGNAVEVNTAKALVRAVLEG